MGQRGVQPVMSNAGRLIRRIGTFDGKAGSLDRYGQLGLADTMVDVHVSDRWQDDETGERMTELTLRAELPANRIEMRVSIPEHGGEQFVEVFSDEER